MSLKEPFQPRDEETLTSTSQATGTGKNFRRRTFQPDWYNSYPWISLCPTNKSVFCYYCRTMKQKGLLTFSSRQESVFSESGFKNWKKALERFKDHKASQAHRESIENQRLLHQPSVASQLETQLATAQALHRTLFEKELSSIRYLLRQGMPWRGVYILYIHVRDLSKFKCPIS